MSQHERLRIGPVSISDISARIHTIDRIWKRLVLTAIAPGGEQVFEIELDLPPAGGSALLLRNLADQIDGLALAIENEQGLARKWNHDQDI